MTIVLENIAELLHFGLRIMNFKKFASQNEPNKCPYPNTILENRTRIIELERHLSHLIQLTAGIQIHTLSTYGCLTST